jgi:NADPH2:quinone reductase
MKGIVLREGAYFLDERLPSPVPGRQELLVAVRAVGLNRADLHQRRNFYGNDAAASDIAGLELAGEVIAAGADVTRHRVGDRIMAVASQACAEQAVVHECMACPVPAGYSWPEAAATYVAFSTAHEALRRADFLAGERLMVQGAGSAVGIAAIQIARLWGASATAGSSRDEVKLERLRALGMDIAVRTGSAANAFARDFDVVIDLIGAGAAAQTLDLLAAGGRWISAGRVSSEPAAVDLAILVGKQAKLMGIATRLRTMHQHAQAIDALVRDLMPALVDRRLVPVIEEEYTLADGARAFGALAESRHFGKLIVVI